jgi:AbiV family abortive infection protein
MTLLDSSEKLLDNGGNDALCAGLYTYAVEEYGKLLFLKKYRPVSGKVTIRYRDEFRDHIKKFSEAITNLPNECTNLRQAIFDPAIFDPEIFDTQEVIADFEARTAIFYSDFKDSETELLSVPPIDVKKLRVAIVKLRAIIAGTTIP